MRLFCLIFAFLGVFAAQFSTPAHAQGVASLLTQEQEVTQEAPDFDQIMRGAAANGVSVVVIDTAGNVLSEIQDPSSTPASGVEPDGSALMALQDRGVQFRAALLERVLQLPAAFNEVVFILRAASPDGRITTFVEVLIYSLLLFAVGMLVEREIFGKRIAKGFVVSRVKEDPQGYSEKMPFLVFRFALGLIGVVVSMTVAYFLGLTIFGTIDDTAIQFTAVIVNIGYLACRGVAMLWRMILSPFLSQYRVPRLSDRDAKRLHRWLWALATIDISFLLFGIWIAELGLNYDVYAFLSSIMSGLVVLLNIAMVLTNYRSITGALLNGNTFAESSLVVRVLARIWAPAVILYMLFAWVALTYDLVLGTPSDIPLIAGAYVILMAIIVVYGVVNFVIERSFARARALQHMNDIMQEEEAQEAALAEAERAAAGTVDAAEVARLEGELEETRAAEEAARAAVGDVHQMNSFEALARRVAGILAFVAGAYAFFYIWDNNGARMVESAVDRMLDIMVIVFIGYIVYHAFRIWIDSKIREEAGDQEEGELGDEGSGSSASRLATLLPLFRNFVLIVVVVTIALIILMELGINVGPLFAGAGIVGVAVGFGSQALVRDIFAGAFFLFDDAFRKGEYLDVGGVKGTVEKISVRSFQLRHHLGALHTIPFGELQVMTNYSRDWVIMKLPLRVTYDTDVEKVRKLIKKLGVRLLDDPVIGENFIQPLKSQGVIEMQDSAMIIRVKFMTKPGDQWLVRKKVYEEIRALFEREGIKFAHREVTVRLADGKVDDLTDEQRKAVSSAAQASVEDEMLEGALAEVGDDR
ncbi:MAG: mechanosensitive ion channel family protein [Pseudomonadota bacterium]